MHDHTTTTYAVLKQGNRFPRKEATLSSNIGELQHDTKHQKREAPSREPASKFVLYPLPSPTAGSWSLNAAL